MGNDNGPVEVAFYRTGGGEETGYPVGYTLSNESKKESGKIQIKKNCIANQRATGILIMVEKKEKEKKLSSCPPIGGEETGGARPGGRGAYKPIDSTGGLRLYKNKKPRRHPIPLLGEEKSHS